MVYELTVVPTAGATDQNRTKNEWFHGFMFKVIASTSTLFKRGMTVCRSDLRLVGPEFDVFFTVLDE